MMDLITAMMNLKNKLSQPALRIILEIPPTTCRIHCDRLIWWWICMNCPVCHQSHHVIVVRVGWSLVVDRVGYSETFPSRAVISGKDAIFYFQAQDGTIAVSP